MNKKSFQEFKADIVKYKLSLIKDINTAELQLDYMGTNGCGSSTAWFDFVPDTNYGVDISSPCHNHDIQWKRANNYNDLVVANIEFAEDLEKVVKKESNFVTIWFRRRRNLKYYLAVKYLGINGYAKERGFEIL